MDEGKSRSVRRRECKDCGYTGRISEDNRCMSCEEEGRRRPRASRRDACKQCLKRVNSGDNGLQCDDCDGWFHAECEEVGDNLFKALEKGSIQLWFCKYCSSQVKKNLMEAKDLKKGYEEAEKEFKKGYAEMEKELREVKKENKGMLEKIKDYMEATESVGKEKKEGEDKAGEKGMREELGRFKTQMEEMQRKVEDVETRWKKREVDLKEFITKTVVEILEERDEKQKRAKNVVIYNLEEPDSGNLGIKEQKEQDMAVCMEIFTNELDVEEVEIMETVRLGKKESEGAGRPRALLVKVSSEQVKWQLVKTAKKLKEARKEKYRRVYVVPDLSKKEREKEKELREQLKEKRDNGERGWYIKKGQLLRGNFQ